MAHPLFYSLLATAALASSPTWATTELDDSLVPEVVSYVSAQVAQMEEDILEQLLTSRGADHPRLVRLAAQLQIPLERIRVRIKPFEADSTTPNGDYMELSLEAVESSDEDVLAFVIAHEYAHLQQQDPLRRLSLAYRLQPKFCQAECLALEPPARWYSVLNTEAAIPQEYFWKSELAADAAAYLRLRQAGMAIADPESLMRRLAREFDVDAIMHTTSRAHPSLSARINQLRALAAAQ